MDNEHLIEALKEQLKFLGLGEFEITANQDKQNLVLTIFKNVRVNKNDPIGCLNELVDSIQNSELIGNFREQIEALEPYKHYYELEKRMRNNRDEKY